MPARPSSDPSREYRPINAISLLLASLTGVLHASLAPLVAGSDLRPSLIVVAVTLITIGFGLGPGAAWAFVGGLTANLLSVDPLGSLPLGLLLLVGLLAAAARLHPSTFVLAALGGGAGTIVVSVTTAVGLWLNAAGAALSLPGLVGAVLPSATLNAVLATIGWAAARSVLRRAGHEPVLA